MRLMKGGQCLMQRKEMPPTRSCSLSREDRVLAKHFRRGSLHPGIESAGRESKGSCVEEGRKSNEAAGGDVAKGLWKGRSAGAGRDACDSIEPDESLGVG